MEFKDVNIKCVTCGREFIFTAREQEFFASKGFKEPKHCRECRQQRKQERDKAFAQASGQEAPVEKELFKVVCAECQRETYVPFKPITGKPVMCKDCFIAKRYGADALKPEKPAAAEEEATPVEAHPETEETSAISKAIPGKEGQIDLESVIPPPEEAAKKTGEESPQAKAEAPQEAEPEKAAAEPPEAAPATPEPEPEKEILTEEMVEEAVKEAEEAVSEEAEAVPTEPAPEETAESLAEKAPEAPAEESAAASPEPAPAEPEPEPEPEKEVPAEEKAEEPVKAPAEESPAEPVDAPAEETVPKKVKKVETPPPEAGETGETEEPDDAPPSDAPESAPEEEPPAKE